MNEEQIRVLQTTVLLLDNGENLVLENNLLPYVKKAKEIEKLVLHEK